MTETRSVLGLVRDAGRAPEFRWDRSGDGFGQVADILDLPGFRSHALRAVIGMKAKQQAGCKRPLL